MTGVRRAEVFRAAFFGVFALDCWFVLPRAALYEASLRVAHVPGLEALTPSPELLVVLWLAQGWLALVVALGGGGRWAIPTLAGLYGFTYLVSQIDGYQHRYLVFVLLVALSPLTRERRWPLRLVLAQMSVVYAWAAVAKIEGPWLDGTLLLRRDETLVRWLEGAAHATGTDPQSVAAVVAVGILALEVFLAVAIHMRSTRALAFVLGVGFHVGVEALGFRIGRFSLYMCALYLLVMPDGWFDRLAARLPDRPLSWRLRAACALLPFAALYAGTDVVREYHATAGQLARDRGDLDLAVVRWERMLAADPRYATGWATLGDVHLEAGRPVEALAALTRARTLAPNDTAVREAEAVALARLKAPADETCAPAECARRAGRYATGRDGPRDDARAARLYRRACDGGHPGGCSNLGYLYRTGRGVPRDEARALTLLRRGCQAGHAFGCRQLTTPASLEREDQNGPEKMRSRRPTR